MTKPIILVLNVIAAYYFVCYLIRSSTVFIAMYMPAFALCFYTLIISLIILAYSLHPTCKKVWSNVSKFDYYSFY